jgi:Winged helix DNA-binding domain
VTSRLELTREQVLGHRRRVQALDARLPMSPESLRVAAWAGLQDSMPRAALLSIHARVAGTEPSTWEDPSLVQLWGPRFGAYVVARDDVPYFSLGRLPDDATGRHRATDLAQRLHAFLDGRAMSYGAAGDGMGVNPNALRYAATTGTVLIRWAGARAPTVWTVPPPDIDPMAARLELARRYLHVFGPTTLEAFRRWAGIGTGEARRAFDALADSVVPVRSPIGDGSILASDESSFRAPTGSSAGTRGAPSARLLPSGDAYFLLHSVDRELLVPDPRRRNELWTPRVWPGAVLLDGDIVGVWRRDGANVTIDSWRGLTPVERVAVEAEAASLPLPDLGTDVRVRWTA